MADPARQSDEPDNPYQKRWSGDDDNYDAKYGSDVPGHYGSDDKTGKSADETSNLAKDEANAGQGSLARQSETPEALAQHENQAGRGYLPEGSHVKNPRGLRSIVLNRRSAAGGGVIATIIAIVFGFSIISGPLQLIHLSQILQKNFFGTENSSSIRMKGLFRYHRTGDIGETRVSKLGSVVFKRTVAKLEGIGFDFSDRNKLTGHLKTVSIDTTKHPAFKDLPKGERLAAAQKHFNVEDKGILSQKGQIIKLDLDATNVKGINFANSFVTAAVGDLQNGKAVTGIGTRSLKKFFNLPRLFSPIEKLTKAAENKLASKLERKKAEKERSQKIRGPIAERAAVARANLKGKLSANSGKLSGALITTAALCIVRDVADDVVAVNRAEIAVPSAIEAVDKISVGSQIQSGQNISLAQVGAIVESFKDESGKSIWEGKALQTTQGKASPGGEDITDGYKQAFSNDTTAQNLKDTIGSPTIGPVDLGGLVCSPVGLVAQGALSIGLLLAGPITLGGSWVAFAGKAAGGAAATAAVLHLLTKQLGALLSSDAIVSSPLSGALGGNLLAYGAREAGNITARASAGIELSDTETLALDKQEQLDSQREFRSKNLASRLLDIYDYRSLASGVIDNTSSNPIQNIAKMASSLTSFNSLADNLFLNLIPRVSAADTPYNWAFPRYGIPAELLNDPSLEDPYNNADKVATALDKDDPKGYTKGYIEKADKCFGVKITKDSGVWDAVAERDVNPNEPEYVNNKCNDIHDEDWKRIILFIFDTRTMTAMACYEEDAQACSQLGFDSSSGDTTDTANEAPILTTLNGYELSQIQSKWIKYIAEEVRPLLPGNIDEQSALAARTTWWSLKEGVLSLDNPFGYSNCGFGDGNNHIGVVEACNAKRWQVGIAGVQVPNFPMAEVESVAKARHPGQSLDQILAGVASLAGHTEGSSTRNAIVNSKDDLRKSLLLRDPATGITLVDRNVQAECINVWKSWCIGGGSLAANPQARADAVSELTSYFKTSNSSGSGIDASSLYADSTGIACAHPTRDLGIQDGYHDGKLVRIRICALPNLPSTGGESDGGYGITGGNKQALVNSRVSGAIYAMVEAAHKEGRFARGAASSFRTMAHQQELCARNSLCSKRDYELVARPGTSNHQMGIAIDFYINSLGIESEQCISVNGRCTAKGHADWEWLEANAAKFGMKPYVKEFWHWSPTGK